MSTDEACSSRVLGILLTAMDRAAEVCDEDCDCSCHECWLVGVLGRMASVVDDISDSPEWPHIGLVN